jgi:hypothetical protein
MRLAAACLAFALPLTASAEDIPGNYPIHPLEAERRMRYEPFEILSAKRTEHGVAGAARLKVRFTSDGLELKMKWKSAPRYKPEGWNNVPRKEAAAYQIQKWFLYPHEYVVPPTVTRCIRLEEFRVVDPEPRPTADSGTCVFGALSLWIVDVEVVKRVFDTELFQDDPIYARTLGDVNILGYLIEHRDGRKSNFLISTLPGGRRVYSIDNGISFGANLFNYFAKNTSRIRVAELPRISIDRLKQVSFNDVERLGVLGHYERDAEGHLVPMPPDANFDPAHGTRVRQDVFQFGLSREEVSDVWNRLGRLLADVNDGKIAVR